MRNTSLLLAAVLITTGCDTVTHHFATLADARAYGLSDRGWLPDVLPASAHDITTNNNVDLNSSTGDFAFIPADGPQMFRRLKTGAPHRSKYSNWANTVADYDRRGFKGWSHQEDGNTWAFFCHPVKGRCDYFMW